MVDDEGVSPVADREGVTAHVAEFCVDRARMEVAFKRCPAVAEVAVVLREERAGEPKLVAYVVRSGEAAPTLDELRRFLWAELPGYAWPAA